MKHPALETFVTYPVNRLLFATASREPNLRILLRRLPLTWILASYCWNAAVEPDEINYQLFTTEARDESIGLPLLSVSITRAKKMLRYLV